MHLRSSSRSSGQGTEPEGHAAARRKAWARLGSSSCRTGIGPATPTTRTIFLLSRSELGRRPTPDLRCERGRLPPRNSDASARGHQYLRGWLAGSRCAPVWCGSSPGLLRSALTASERKPGGMRSFANTNAPVVTEAEITELVASDKMSWIRHILGRSARRRLAASLHPRAATSANSCWHGCKASSTIATSRSAPMTKCAARSRTAKKKKKKKKERRGLLSLGTRRPRVGEPLCHCDR